MAKLFKEINRVGDSTTSYPFRPLELPDGYRGKPDHKVVMCIACSACAIACPPNAITMHLDENSDNIIWDISYARCIFCGRCHEVCPVDAIELSTEFELSTMSKADLDESCAYPVAKCVRCGKPHASKKELEYAKQVLTSVGGAAASNIDVIDLCENCRRRDDAHAAKMAGGNKGVC